MKVNSSNLSDIHFEQTQEEDGEFFGDLFVTFKNGRKYVYSDIPEQVYDELVNEASNPRGSVGSMFSGIVRNRYEGVEV